MGKGCGSQPYHQQPPPFSSANLKYSDMPPDAGVDNVHPLSLPTFVNSDISVSVQKMVGRHGPQLLYHNYPYMPCALYLKSGGPRNPVFSHTGTLPDTEVAEAQKNLFIIDHSVNRTSLFVSSLSPLTAKREPIILPDGRNRKEYCFFPEYVANSNGLDMDEVYISGGEKSEMHEDTEEIDALLYSDGENEEDDEASTGHSPLDLLADERNENIADSDGFPSLLPTKKRKLDVDLFDPELMDTASSGKAEMKVLPPGNDTELSCVKASSDQLQRDLLSWSGCNHAWGRNERIREAVNILRSIVPGSKGKDAIVVLEEAIQYLRSLKLKARALEVGSPIQ